MRPELFKCLAGLEAGMKTVYRVSSKPEALKKFMRDGEVVELVVVPQE
ncbi:MAG: hypothetical protein QW074_05065 [Candidatus Caldarchaeum sp.]